jgi:DNA-binding beta-propeller fold protein YncE
MALSRALGRVGLFVLAGLFFAIIPTVASAEDTVAFTIRDARIAESSGLAADPVGNIYWTVNDSGDRGAAYGIGLDGKVQGTLNFRAEPFDVEAVAMHEDRLYVADIGDNNRQRDFVRVFFFENPRANGLTVTYHAYDFSYPDGPQNAETLLVSDTGRLFIVTKGQDAAIYRAPREPDREGVNELKKVGSAPPGVTDGTFLPGGDQIALLTYDTISVIDANTYEVLVSSPIPPLPQAESLTLSLDQHSLLVGSEGKRSKVYAVPVPSRSTPTPTPSEAPGTEADVPDDSSSALQNQKGTLLALGLAGVVALVAGTVVALVRQP